MAFLKSIKYVNRLSLKCSGMMSFFRCLHGFTRIGLLFTGSIFLYQLSFDIFPVPDHPLFLIQEKIILFLD